MVALRLAYDAAFGMPSSWGTPGDVRDDLDFESEVLPVLATQATPANFGRFEFIRLVVGIPGSGFSPPPGFFPGRLFLLPRTKPGLDAAFGLHEDFPPSPRGGA